MDSKITALTDQLYKEGVEKGEKQAQQIIDGAKAQAKRRVTEAIEFARASAYPDAAEAFQHVFAQQEQPR